MKILFIQASIMLNIPAAQVMPGLDWTLNGVTQHVTTIEFDKMVRQERLILIENGANEAEMQSYDEYQARCRAEYLQTNYDY
jgi:hypothetical protein